MNHPNGPALRVYLRRAVALLSLCALALVLYSWVRSYSGSEMCWMMHGSNRRLLVLEHWTGRVAVEWLTVDEPGATLNPAHTWIQTNQFGSLLGTRCVGSDRGTSARLLVESENEASLPLWVHSNESVFFRLWRFGFHRIISSARFGLAHHFYKMQVPHWFLALTLLSPWCVWWWRQRQARRRWEQRLAKHLCVHCGYDLRASKDKCPECGMLIPIRCTVATISPAH